jgi:uroporphyrinogen decarboxylase
MQSWEIVRKAIRFEGPPRLPVVMPTLGVCDRADVPLRELARCADPHPGEDEWGCIWGTTDLPNMGQVVAHPLPDIAELDSFRFPDYSDDSRYADVASFLDTSRSEGRYVSCGIFMLLFERMHALHGFTRTLEDLYVDRAGMEKLADRVVETQLRRVRELARRFPGAIHAWHMSDDWGTQRAAFVSRELWDDFFLPRYKRIFDAMHGAGCDVWLHSCGRINALIEGYIRAGVAVVNIQQPRALGIEEIGAIYQGRIAFETLADIQVTLPGGDAAEIEKEVGELMEHWATRRGGLLLGDYGDERAIGVKSRTTKRTMYESFSRHSARLYGEPLPAIPDAARKGD